MAERFWLMWGWRDPEKRPPPRLVVKGQEVYSENSYNLWLDIDPDTQTMAGEFHLGRLVEALAISYEPAMLRESCLWEDPCIRCRENTRVPCQLFVQPQPRGWAKELSFPDAVRSLMQREPQVGDVTKWCTVLEALADMTVTPMERRFYELYLAWGLSRAQRDTYSYVKEAVAEPDEMGLGADVGTEDWIVRVLYTLIGKWRIPALLPQVVLNFVRTKDLPDWDPDRHFFDSNAGRADFVFVHEGERHVIEIDGPIHHASEKGHTRNLRVDRTLRRQGWQVHRFSNLEVREAKDFREFAWELGFT